jgi:5'-nucleotidase
MPESPLILVTNDDGLLSPGLRAAAEAVADLGDLLIAAPATQQTAMSRAFVHDADAGIIERVELNVAGHTVPGYAISGSPVMAVTHAVLELARQPIRLCVSGINYGENIGAAIGASGTVGAALEADAHSIPGIAASITTQVSEWRTFGTVDWAAAKHFTRRLASQVLDEGMPDGVSVLNLNVPQSATPQTELRKTVQSRQPYYVRSRPSPGRRLDQPYVLTVEVVVDRDRLEPWTDIYAVVCDRVASVTPLTSQMTADTHWEPRAADGSSSLLEARAIGVRQEPRSLPANKALHRLQGRRSLRRHLFTVTGQHLPYSGFPLRYRYAPAAPHHRRPPQPRIPALAASIRSYHRARTAETPALPKKSPFR